MNLMAGHKMKKCGINPKPKHFDGLLSTFADVGFLEFHTENLFAKGLAYQKVLQLREKYEFSLHSIGLSLGSFDGLNEIHLEKIAKEIAIFSPFLVSEHLSFSGYNGVFSPDLMPVPLNEESLGVFVRNIEVFQNRIKRQILIENPSVYFAPIGETYELADFMNEICQKTGCAILLDINNLEVCRQNVGIDAHKIINGLKKDYIKQIHLAGYKVQPSKNGEIFLDNHGDFVFPKVWELYENAIAKFGDIPCLLEWDNDVPELEILIKEAQNADMKKQKVLSYEYA
jgi:uncharacterized protein